MNNPEGFKFVGPKSESDPDRLEAIKALNLFYSQGRKEIPGEIQKTDFYNEAIRTVNQILDVIYRYFDIKDGKSVDPKQIHFLHRKEFDEIADSSNAGSYLSTTGAIRINADLIGENRAHLIATLLHEGLHAVSEQYFFVDLKEDGTHVFDARVGLRTSSQWKDSRTENRGLNEFLVNTLVYYSLKKISKTLESRFGITINDIEGSIYGSGSRHSDFFEKIGEIMSESDEISEHFIQDIVRSHFSGSLRSLAPIDLVFGPGSIRVLGFLDTFDDGEKCESTNKLVEEYFLQADEERKKDIIEKLDKISSLESD